MHKLIKSAQSMRRKRPRIFTALVGLAFVGSLTGAIFYTQTSSAAANTLSNPGCETNTANFKAWQATLARSTSVKRTGTASCKVTRSSGTTFTMESTQLYANPLQGQVFTGTAWVRADTNTGKQVALALRESGGSAATRTVEGPKVALSTTWQKISNDITIQSTGRTSLLYYIVHFSAASGNHFYADDMEFYLGSTPPANTAPTVSLSAPANNATVSGTQAVSANATDDKAGVSVQFKLDGANIGAADTTAPYSVNWDTTTATNATHTLTAVATDSDNVSTTSSTVSVTVNNAPPVPGPTVSITSPASGATVSTTVDVTADATDTGAVTGVQFKLDGANLGAAVTTAPYTFSWDTTTATNGNHNLAAVATNAAGGTTTSTAVPVTVSNTVAPGTMQPLKVSDNNRYLVKQDGTPFFWMADTAWSLYLRLTREDTVRYLDARKNQGYNVVQAAAIFPEVGSRLNQYGDDPINGTVATPVTTPGNNPANAAEYDYWDHVDYAVDEAANRGIYTAMLPAWSNKQAGSIITSSNAQAYGQWLGARYKDKPVIWVMGGDDANYNEAIWRALAKGIAIGVSGTEDYSKVLMTYHPIGDQSSSTAFHNDAWLDFNMVQSGHCLNNNPLSFDLVETDYPKSPTKPVIDGEPLYEDHLICWDTAQGYSTPQQVRNFAYWSVFAGSFGHTYGHHAVWQMYAPGRSAITGVRTYWYDALNHPAGNQMQYMKKLVESRPFLSRVPDQTVLTSAAGSGLSRIQATRASDGAYFMVYSPNGQAFTVDMAKVSGTTARTYWYDPRTGATTDNGTRNTTGTASFTPPAGGDWVLVADDTARGFAAPGL
jgi:hypothetical protein